MTSTSDPFPTWAEQPIGDSSLIDQSRAGQVSSAEMSVDEVISATYRQEWGRLLSLLVARTRRLDPAEDALSEAFARASDRWSREGVPANPAGWLYTTAWRLILARLRAEAVAGRKVPLLAVRHEWSPVPSPERIDALDDERLQLILLCCHPALPRESQSALALRLVMGTSTEEIARLFLVSPATMAARITRAKKKIVAVGIPLVLPVAQELRVRLDEVCRTIYLAFTAGYTPCSGVHLLRADLAGEAVELASILHRAVPHADQVRSLLALLLLQHARREARVHDGELITLAEQDRMLWRWDELERGIGLIDSVPWSDGYAGELRLQALIAREHGCARQADETSWSAIAKLYERLEEITGSPIVRLNRAVAVAEADGPTAGLALLDGLEVRLATNHRLPSVRAELARRSGQLDVARVAYQEAIELCTNDVERTFLTGRLRSIDDS